MNNTPPSEITSLESTSSDTSSASSAIWYYEQQGERKGAVTEPEIISLIKAGTLNGQSAVWKKGFADWTLMEKTELAQHLDDSVPPPLTGEHVNNNIVWVLAFAPLIGNLLEFALASMLYSNDYQAEQVANSGKLFFVSVILNIALCYWDEIRLEKAGIKTENFKGFIWLVPVYLFQRAKALKHNLAYFIVWMVCFAIILFG